MASKPPKPSSKPSEVSRISRGRTRLEAFPEGLIAKQPVSQLPWGQIIRLIQMVKDSAIREFYIRETLTHGWSRAILEIQITNNINLQEDSRPRLSRQTEFQAVSVLPNRSISRHLPTRIPLDAGKFLAALPKPKS